MPSRPEIRQAIIDVLTAGTEKFPGAAALGTQPWNFYHEDENGIAIPQRLKFANAVLDRLSEPKIEKPAFGSFDSTMAPKLNRLLKPHGLKIRIQADKKNWGAQVLVTVVEMDEGSRDDGGSSSQAGSGGTGS